MEAEALDVGAVLIGDVALLVMAPLVIYAALKMIWEEQVNPSPSSFLDVTFRSLRRRKANRRMVRWWRKCQSAKRENPQLCCR